MDLTNLNVEELVQLYSGAIKELKRRDVLRTKNVIGELGEHVVIEHYLKDPNLPTLHSVPVGTQNINALSDKGERYSIKSLSGNVTGVFYGLNEPGSKGEDKALFEYVVLCKFDDDCAVEGIYQIDWEAFERHKRWHSRMKAWNLALTKSLKDDSKVIYEESSRVKNAEKSEKLSVETALAADISFEWNKSARVNHQEVRKKIAEKASLFLKKKFLKNSQARYVSEDNDAALFVLSASYSQRNQEYWYSINDENIPWLELYPESYVAFGLGSAESFLLFKFDDIKEMLKGCLKTKEEGKKKAHFHLSFAVDGSKVYFKKKLPEHDFINVSANLVCKQG